LSTAPLAPPRRPQKEYLRQSDAWERLIDARTQDTEILTLAQEISTLALRIEGNIGEIESARVAAKEAIAQGDTGTALAYLAFMQGLVVAQSGLTMDLGLKAKELAEIERRDVKQHEEEADRLRIRDREIRGHMHWRP
jgi:hypothetical protein